MSSLGKVPRTFHGDPRPKTSIANGKRDHGDWLVENMAKAPEKVRADQSGLTPKAVGNIRQRRNKISWDNFVELCFADPDFGASFCEYIGVLNPGEAEVAGALTRAVNAYQRKHGRE